MDNRVPIEEFNAALWKRFKGGKIRNVYPMTKYNDIVEKIKAMEDNPPCNIPGEYYLLRKFIVVNVDGKERLSCKPENCTFGINTQDKNVSQKKFYVALEEIYNYIDEAHKMVKHGGRDRIVRIIQNQGIVNITRDTVELFLSFCKVCRPRKRESTRKPGSKTVVPSSLHNDRICDSPLNVSSEGDCSERPQIIRNQGTVKIDLNQTRQCNSFCSFTRGYIDLIDLSSSPDGEYRFVFLYLDLQTCFSVLYPIRCKCTYEIVSHLLNIFTLIGPPQILHSSFEHHFLLTIIHDLKQSWPDITIVSGSDAYFELHGVAQNCISEINSLLKSWMSENNSGRWSLGLRFIQLRKNTSISGSNTKSPYECFFGHQFETHTLPSNTDGNLTKQVDTEEHLLHVLNQQDHSGLQSCERLQVSVDPTICNLVQNHIEQNSHLSESETDISHPRIVKVEPISDNEASNINGFEISDSSNDVCTSPNIGNLEIVIKQEIDDDS